MKGILILPNEMEIHGIKAVSALDLIKSKGFLKRKVTSKLKNTNLAYGQLRAAR